jgi:ubiquinone/menaquinone biosynthesis C-methylase UbiE
MRQEWQSYDSAADTFDRISAASFFARPAQDLVARIGIPPAGAILDIGTGTGTAALVAKSLSDRNGVVVGVDPSLKMLRIALSHGLSDVAAGAVPGLPFSMSKFDRVLASFVLAHVASYRDALLDMVRVLKVGGKLGVTAWGSLQNEFRQRWQSLAEGFVGKESLSTAMQQALPWEEWFENPNHLREAFQDAGLIRSEVNHTRYTIRTTIAEFLETRETALQGRFVRQALDDKRWEEFKQALSAEFYGKFKDPIELTRDVYIAIGIKPDHSRAG